MTQILKLKRSAVAGKVPTTADLQLGELAINTFDGKLYFEKDNGTASIVSVATSTDLNDKQDTLISGTNIKTINGTSLLGSGNLAVADLSTTQTLSGKTLSSPLIKGYTEANTNWGYSNGSYTVDLSVNTFIVLRLLGGLGHTVIFPTAASSAGKSFTLLIKNASTSGTGYIIWGTSISWPNATAPTIPAEMNKASKFVFISDGEAWYGALAGSNYQL